MIPWYVDFFLSFFLYIISGLVFIQAANFPEVSAKFPRLTAVFTIVLAVLLMVNSIKRRKEEHIKEKTDYKIVYKIIAGLIIYTFILKVFGYLISTIILTGYIIYIMQYTKKRNIIIISCGAILVIYLIFKMILQVPLPTGFLNVI